MVCSTWRAFQITRWWFVATVNDARTHIYPWIENSLSRPLAKSCRTMFLQLEAQLKTVSTYLQPMREIYPRIRHTHEIEIRTHSLVHWLTEVKCCLLHAVHLFQACTGVECFRPSHARVLSAIFCTPTCPRTGWVYTVPIVNQTTE